MSENNQIQIPILSNKYYIFCKNIYEKKQYKEDYELIYKIGVLYDLYSISSNEVKDKIKTSLDNQIVKLNDTVIKRLLETAFIFANLNADELTVFSTNEEKEIQIKEIDNIKNDSYRIAISVYYYWKYIKEIWSTNNSFFNNNIVYRLFTRLWILTKIRNLYEDDNIDIDSIDLQWKIELTNKELNNRFSITDYLWEEKIISWFWTKYKNFIDDESFFSDFQFWLMEKLIKSGNSLIKSFAISAPTSAWKTFILKKYIIFKLIESVIEKENINIAFIVPSKSLINELNWDFIDLFKNYNIDSRICNIHTHIWWDDFLQDYSSKSNLFILTQERLNYFYNDIKFKNWWESFKFDIVVVDEAHKVWYWYRWTLLSYIISKIKQDNKNIQIILLAPLLSKLHKFKDEFWLNLLSENFSNFWLVAKNQILVEQKKFWWRYHMCFYLNKNTEENELFKFKLAQLDSDIKFLNYLANNFSTNEQSIIFRYRPDYVRDQAQDLAKINSSGISDEDLIDYINDIFPKDFELINFLKKWVWYHNWALPISIKSKIEDLFKNWDLKYLCANSTMLEWVNLPAKNIFIWGDWEKETISTLDFKNLVWRAGRLNHHLSWNVFYVKFKEYEEKIIDEKNSTWELINNISNLLWNENKFEEFLAYIKPWSILYKEIISDKDLRDKRKEFEYLTWYLVSNVIDSIEKNTEVRYNENLELLDKNYFIDRLEQLKNWWKKDFFDKVWQFIYWNKEYKTEKIEELRKSIYTLCNELKVNNKSEFDKNFLNIVKKNIFIDPRKQLDFYDLVISWGQKFVLENINYFSNINTLLSDEKNEKSEKLKLLVNEVDKYFIFTPLYKINSDADIDFDYIEFISKLMNQWISWVPLKNILEWRKNYFKTLKRITDEIQFHFLNWISIFIELANLGYKNYVINNHFDWDEYVISQFDAIFLFYLEIWNYYPNLVYLISKGVSRESAIRLYKMNIISPFIWDNDSKKYFLFEKNRILKILRDNNKNIIYNELLRFIYNN